MIGYVLFTYSPSVEHPRHEYAITTLHAALANLHTSEETFLHIADDGSDPRHIEALEDMARQFGFEPTYTNATRGGYGRSYNLMCQAVHHRAEFVLPIEDDWELEHPLDLDPLVAALRESESDGCIRLGYLGWYSDLVGRMVRYAEQNFIQFMDGPSTDPHIWTGHPRLEKVSWQQEVGAWPEGISPGHTEITVSNRPEARRGVLWPLDLVRTWGDLFAHIGSVQAR